MKGDTIFQNKLLFVDTMRDLKNLFNLYLPICNYWMIFDNSNLQSDFVAEGYADKKLDIKNISIFDIIKNKLMND